MTLDSSNSDCYARHMKHGLQVLISLMLVATLGWSQSSVNSGGTVTTTGAITNGHCAKFASGTVIQDAGVCGGGGGSGTVSPGTTSKLPKYTNGAGATVGDSLASDDGTTFLYGGSGGLSALSVASTGTASPDVLTEQAAPTTPSATLIDYWADSTDHRVHDKSSGGTIGTTVVSDTGAANNFLTGVSVAGVISKAQPSSSNLSDGTALVKNNAANTGTAAMTLDISNSTVANAFKVPVGAGLTSGADGVIAYDTTNKNTHIRVNGADAVALGSASTLGVGAIPKGVSATVNIMQASSLADNGSIVASTEPWKFGTAGANPHQDLTMGSTTSDMTVQSSATCTNITGMTWTINASKNYRLTCNITRTLAASATIGYCLGGPGTATSYNLVVRGNNGASSAYNQIETGIQTAYGTKTASSTANAATATDEIYAFIQNGSTASGTALTLQTFGNGTNNLTVKANSSCDLKQVN